jgi:hypothetical protein
MMIVGNSAEQRLFPRPFNYIAVYHGSVVLWGAIGTLNPYSQSTVVSTVLPIAAP